MESSTLTRPITKEELKTIKMIQGFEDLIDKKRLAGVFNLSKRSLDILIDREPARLIKAKWNDKDSLFSVLMSVQEISKYIKFCCDEIGMTLNIADNTVTLCDQNKVSIDEI